MGAGRVELPGALERLRRVWLDDGRMPDEVDGFAEIINENLTFIERTVTLRGMAGEAAALSEIATGRGKVIMDGARQSADGHGPGKSPALSGRSTAADRRFARAELIIFALFIGLSLVLNLSATVIYRNLAARRVLLVEARTQADRFAAIFDGSQDSLLTTDGQGVCRGPAARRGNCWARTMMNCGGAR